MQVDPRGQRFAAALTSVVLAAVLVTGSAWLLAAQVAVFAVGALAGVRYSPYGLLYTRLVRPRLGPPPEPEAPGPPRFAQAVGAVFGIAGLVGLLASVPVLGFAAVAAALFAAVLNAAFGFCLGCEMYLLLLRALPRDRAPAA